MEDAKDLWKMKSLGNSLRRPKQTAGFGFWVREMCMPRRCRCGRLQVCLIALLHARSLQLLFTFVRLLLLCTRSHCLFSKPRVALRFCFLLSHRSVPTNGRCCRVIQDLTVAFSTARPTSSPSSFLVDNSCYGRLRLGRQLVIELAQVAHSPS
jgi:hypothetical protein